MPVLVAIVGAVATGLMYWLLWGKGLEYIDYRWQEKRDAKRRAEALADRRRAPLRAMTDAREAATVLMLMIAMQRGVPTPEQTAAIEREMRAILGLDKEAGARLASARFAAEQAPSFEVAVEDLAALLRGKLEGREWDDLFGMLERVAALHGGPTLEQQRAISLARRRLPPLA
jgi:hypothetical protein